MDCFLFIYFLFLMLRYKALCEFSIMDWFKSCSFSKLTWQIFKNDNLELGIIFLCSFIYIPIPSS